MRLLQLLIFALPWIAVANVANPYLEPKELALMAGLWGLLLCASWRRPLQASAARNRWTPWVVGFVIATGLWHFTWAYMQRSPTQQQVVYNVYTWLPSVNVVIALLAVRLLSITEFASPVGAQLATQWWCASAVLSALYALGQFVGLDQWYIQPHGYGFHQWHTIAGSFGNPEYLALYLACLLPLYGLFRPKRYLVGAALLGLILWLTHIPGTWLIAAIGLAAFATVQCWGRNAWINTGLLLGGVLALIVGGWAITHLAVHDERLAIWARAWALLRNVTDKGDPRAVASWTGRGLGAVAMLWDHTTDLWVHNEWLQGLIELGVIGMTLVGGMVISTTKTAWRRAQTSLLDAGWFGVWVAWLSASVIFPCAHWAHTAWIGLCAMAVIEREETGYAPH